MTTREQLVKTAGSEEAFRKHMSEMGKRKKGKKSPGSGTAALSPEERHKRAKAAAEKRWSDKEKQDAHS